MEGSPLHCDLGMDYWCLSEVTARECRKESFCGIIQEAWNFTSTTSSTTSQPTSTAHSLKIGWPYVTPAPGRYTGLYPSGIFGK
ncbi:uncharacterized protein [Fopius arisanus]|uniref:Uncharacterized protein isoform X2 n=1 Tax=Fopius arisanus TaxID=64838 RepID=A0A9R1T9Y3_9HYME|nr:PREDICTED: uncharacterized protein LOC105267877 isoform X2 [Fopius arisanus]